MKSILEGRAVRTLGYPPVADWKEGDELAGKYLGSRAVTLPGGGKPFRSHLFVLDAATCAFRRKDETVSVSAGETVAVSGGYLDGALEGVPEGTLVGIRYEGLEPKPKGGKNAGKIFRVMELAPAK